MEKSVGPWGPQGTGRTEERQREGDRAASPGPSESELLDRVRGGDRGAYAVLYARHEPIMHRYAVRLAGAGAAADLVAEAFARVLRALLAGGGPRERFAAYVVVTIRNSHAGAARRRRREVPVGDDVLAVLGEGGGTGGGGGGGGGSGSPDEDGDRLTRAFSALPRDRQVLLWAVEVEDVGVGEVARAEGVRPGAVSARLFRAREALREAYLATYLPVGPEPPAPACAAARDRLPRIVRSGMRAVRDEQALSHVRACWSCFAAYRALRRAATRMSASPESPPRRSPPEPATVEVAEGTARGVAC